MRDDLQEALTEARELGFLGPGPLQPHVASATAFAEAIGSLDGAALDLGSGGGVPGLLLADMFRDSQWVLLDQHRRRTSFLARTVAALGWVERVRVVRASAVAAAHDPTMRAQFALVVARSFGPPSLTAEIGTAFLERDGRMAVAEPPRNEPERWPAGPLDQLGLTRMAGTSRIAMFRRSGALADDVPRSDRKLGTSPRW